MASKAGKSVTKGGTGNMPFGKSSAGTVVRGKKDAAVSSITSGKGSVKGSSTNHFAAKMAKPKMAEGNGSGSSASC